MPNIPSRLNTTVPKIEHYYNLSVPDPITDPAILLDLSLKEICPVTDLERDKWDTSIMGEPVKVYDIVLGFPSGKCYALVNLDKPKYFDVMVPFEWLSEIKPSVKLCSCDIGIIMTRGCQCGGV